MSAAHDAETTRYELDAASRLLDPGPLTLEMGVQRQESGVLHVAARTDMPHCKGRMFEWWFRFAPDTRRYACWHPIDHVSSAWRETSPMAHICRDTSDGMVLRSRFWLGAGTGLPAEELRATIPEEIGLGLMRHATTEFKYLSRFLPSLYIADQRDVEPVDLPW